MPDHQGASGEFSMSLVFHSGCFYHVPRRRTFCGDSGPAEKAGGFAQAFQREDLDSFLG